jgi:hypothetical protein
MPSADRDPNPNPTAVERAPVDPCLDAAVVAAGRIDHAAPDTVDDAIDQALTMIGQAVAADRAYVFAYDFEVGLCHNTHEWCADGIEPQIALLQAFPLHLVPEWVARHRAGEVMDVAGRVLVATGERCAADAGVAGHQEPGDRADDGRTDRASASSGSTRCVASARSDPWSGPRSRRSPVRSCVPTLASVVLRDALARASAAHDAVR